MTFEKFRNRVVIEAQLVAVTPLFIGARADSFKPDSINGSCVKDVNNRPYIPGSSLKGALRAFLSDVMGEPIDSFVSKAFKKKEQREEFEPEELAREIVRKSTDVDILFGSTVMAGKVKFADAIPVEDRVKTDIRNGVAIDRDTRTAVPGALYDTEVVPSGSVFNFIASAENLTSGESKLFGELIEYFAEGNITIGGRSRAGLGNVKLRNVKVTIYSAVPGGFPVSEEISCDQNEIKEAVCKCSPD